MSAATVGPDGTPRRLAARLLPGTLTALRGLLAPVIFLCITSGAPVWLPLGVLAAGVATDVLDGALARRLGTASSRGAYLDATADLLFALGAYAAFVASGVQPYWAPLVIVAAFVWFVATPGSEVPRYDPVGRHYGTLLYAGAALILALDDFAVSGSVLAALILMSLASLATRAFAPGVRAERRSGCPAKIRTSVKER